MSNCCWSWLERHLILVALIFHFLLPLNNIYIRTLSTYIWNKANFIKVVTQLWIMECNHLGKHRQIFWNDKQTQDHGQWYYHMLLAHNRAVEKEKHYFLNIYILVFFKKSTINQQVNTTTVLLVTIIFSTEEEKFHFSSLVLPNLDFQQWFTWFILRLWCMFNRQS